MAVSLQPISVSLLDILSVVHLAQGISSSVLKRYGALLKFGDVANLLSSIG